MLRNKRKHWTEEDDRRLLALRAAGNSVASIAMALKRSTKAITLRLAAARARERRAEQKAQLTARQPTTAC